MAHWLQVLVQTPAHSQIAGPLSYQSECALSPGTLVRVPLGKREMLGIVWDAPTDDSLPVIAPDKTKAITAALDAIAPLSAHWRELVSFAASYYQRSAGEVALAALPPQLRDLSSTQLARRLKRKAGQVKPEELQAPNATKSVAPTAEQTRAIAQFDTKDGPFLLFGATGSGKTEVYLHCVEQLLAREPQAQAMVMVPEINLTPQLEARFVERFAPLYGADAVVSLHSGLTNPQRLKSWLAAHSGEARIVLGTRMAVFASMPALRLIVVDEEHDPSYKQQEGARYSARDLAVYRGRLEGAKVVLGSATPSLESWHHSRPAEEGGRYLRLLMPSRIGDGSALPRVRRVDMNHQPKKTVFSPPLLNALRERVARGEQSMVFLNRRGYAPVLGCSECDWKSECPHCSAFRVFHKIDRTLRCHHCGLTERVPRHCPSCGNPDIQPLGRGTEHLEEHLAELLADVRRPGSANEQHPDGQPVRIARIDADSTRLKGALQSQLAQVHAGEVDVLVGTQMIAKGHDFRRITLVAAVNPDSALFSSDFRAPERLFSLLMQAAGRAGRDAGLGGQSEMWVQTFHPTHPLFEALKKHDYPAFAAQQLEEREQAGMPPFSFQALVRAEARTQEAAQAFLTIARETAAALETAQQQVTLYPAVPMSIQRIANVERAQMLIESGSRVALQRFLSDWSAILHDTRSQPACKGLIRWAVDVDPLAI
ncbi:MAG: primosomal protein N' [Gammaproteobacteria bacterium]|nr:primosomal protein N' [Gammaproteobacteria bacterium]MBU0785999.1 primosomal protein N' [Gammaproteobacteria bacterium]MBU0816612.1 primosomal protein N' [Gammaproteobacteria bacterium]MBU1788413.1 primosomal protein N' [Gammaproteobacteria bacterium]